MPQRRVNTSIWTGCAWFQEFTANEKLLYLYLGRNDHDPGCGIYTITIKTLAHELDLPISQIEKALMGLSPHVLYDKRISLVFVRRFVQEQRSSDSWLKSVEVKLNQLKPHPFIKEFLQVNHMFKIGYGQPIDSMSIDTYTDTNPLLNLLEGGPGGDSYPPSLPLEAEVDIYEKPFADFWAIFPAKNGKRLDKAGTELQFRKINPSRIPDVLKAVKNYASSQRVADGLIRDPIRFFRHRDETTPFWQNWIEPEIVQPPPGVAKVCESGIDYDAVERAESAERERNGQ